LMTPRAVRQRTSVNRVVAVLLAPPITVAALVAAAYLLLLASTLLLRIKGASDRIQRFSTRANRYARRIAGTRLGMLYFSLSALHHVGRRSGRTYMTPLSAYPLGDGFVLAVAYPKVDWCDNVLTAGKCTLTWNGKGYALQRPELIGRREAMKGLSAAGQAVRDCPRHETIPVAA
jgi:hypothetical protein